MENTLSDLIIKASLELQKETERLIKLRIKERVKEEIDFNKEFKKRFPRILREFNSIDRSEHWYFNDNTDNGLHLISFYEDINSDFMDEKYKATIGFKYL